MKKTAVSTGIVILLAACWALLAAPIAHAHGGLEGSSPEDGARVKKVPRRVTMVFSEVPSKDSVMKVVDGCKRNVVGETSVVGDDLVGTIQSAQPGKWKATYRVISAEDGHLTKGSLAFTVAGKKDCNPNDDEVDPTDEPTDAATGDGGGKTPAEGDDDEFPVVPVAVGAAGLVIVGIVVRRVSGG